ncbi:MAG: glycerate kinase [Clostridia bacterium]|nr:glycerate kinase [Clostridia bacterium]
MQKDKIKIIISPDSFKGTMSSFVVGNIIKDEIEKTLSNVEIIRLSISDGGENTIDTFYENCKGEYVEDHFTSPNFVKQKFKYVKFNKTAVIEAGQCAGLNFATQKNPMKTTSLGMGEQVLHAISSGIKNIYLALGGSATNDGGAGMLSAMGVKFFDFKNNEFIPVGGTLKNIKKIDVSNLEKNIKNISFTAMYDVTNPLYGKNGASYVYAKQKGASAKEIIFLDEGLKYFAEVVKNQLGIDMNVFGSGSAGGIGGACYAFLNAEMLSGIDVVLEKSKFNEHLKNTSLIITGEGKFDSQSIMGKVVGGIAKRATKAKIPLIVFAGKNEIQNQEQLRKIGISKIYQTSTENQTFEEIKKNCKEDLRKAIQTFISEINLYI